MIHTIKERSKKERFSETELKFPQAMKHYLDNKVEK
jgi:hypothetical protein